MRQKLLRIRSKFLSFWVKWLALAIMWRGEKKTTFNHSIWATICLMMFVYSKLRVLSQNIKKLCMSFHTNISTHGKLSKHRGYKYTTRVQQLRVNMESFWKCFGCGHYPIVSSSITWKESEWNPIGRCNVYSSPQKGLRFFHTVAVLKREVYHAYYQQPWSRHISHQCAQKQKRARFFLCFHLYRC